MALRGEGRTLLFGFFLFSLLLFSSLSCAQNVLEEEYDDEESTGCSSCEPGTFYDPLAFNGTQGDKCSPCDEGECVSGSMCYSCPNGTSQSLSGQSSCNTCPNNYISSQNGTKCLSCGMGTQPDSYLTSCISCQQGYFNNQTEGGSCVPCNSGSYSPNSTHCLPCGSGAYNPSSAQKLCRVCGPGYYNPRPGSSLSSSCLACNPGTYCKFQQTAAPVVCPENFYCPVRASQPIPCGWLTSSHVGSSECQYKTIFYVLISIGGAVVFTLIVVGVVFILNRRDSVVDSPDKAELIPQSLPGPVYSGY